MPLDAPGIEPLCNRMSLAFLDRLHDLRWRDPIFFDNNLFIEIQLCRLIDIAPIVSIAKALYLCFLNLEKM